MKYLFAAAAVVFVVAVAVVPSLAAAAGETWTAQTSGTTASFRGLSVVDERVAWASGTNGTFARTVDGGRTWRASTVEGAGELDFRDVEAFDANTAYLMSAGEGALSRIYKTKDAGKTWALLHQNPGPAGFFDAIAFWDERNGLVMSDPVDGRFLVLTTSDAGRTWTRVAPDRMPPALDKEGGFAASGTCLVVEGKSNAWFATGGAATARVFRTTDRGRTWAVADTPVAAGDAATGIFSLAFADARNGIAVGGDYAHPETARANLARTSDGGKTWTAVAGAALLGGYRSAAAYVPGSRGRTIFAVGPTGTDVSRDGGARWQTIDTTGFNSVALGRDGIGWAVGAGGAIGKLVRARP